MARAALPAALSFGVLAAVPAHAQFMIGGEGWSGETSLSATATTGNAEATDFGAGLKFEQQVERWKQAGAINYDYGISDGDETKNRLFTNYQLDFTYNHRAFAYSRGSYALDEFDGYDYRANFGAGLGYDVLAREATTWSLQAGPAVQIDAIEEVIDPETDTITTVGDTQTNTAVGLGSRFATNINEHVDLTNDTDVTWTEETTIIASSAGLTTQLLGALAARFSVDVKHDTEPPAGTEATDTTTRASLIYTFGE
ncbi:MAG: DUF481 domain-containing protein [Caulobacterales bacterium]|nr:DUF481 domain-containing protein [Caulobacterales bacterium]